MYLLQKIITMKKSLLFTTCLMVLLAIAPSSKAQDWNIGLDINSSYIWRGSKFGSGPAFQPTIEFSAGNFAVGAWGSVNSSTDEAAEVDLYLNYGFDFGLTVGLTDYYYPGTDLFNFSTKTGSHAVELNVGYQIGGLSLSGNYFINEAGSVGNAGSDLYFEIKYGFKHVDIFAGAGDGLHTVSGDFCFVNLGLGTSKEIKITDSFSLPLHGSLILNPATEQMYIVVGISL